MLVRAEFMNRKTILPRRKTMQFVQVRFPRSSRLYTYRNDGVPFQIGDEGLVQTANGEMAVEIVDILEAEPRFDTKPISRKTLV